MQGRDILIYLAMKHSGNWDAIFEEISNARNNNEAGTTTEQKLREIVSEEDAKETFSKIKSKVVTILDEDYPESLKQATKPPFVLFYHGNISLLNNKFKSISVVGARKFSEKGKTDCIELVNELAKELIVISGMAAGIDSIAHEAAIAAGGKTVAVLGSGINYIYPPENRKLYEKLKKDHLVISEYPNDTKPTTGSFPVRNRIIAYLSNCVFVPEAKLRSGTSITVGLALSNGSYICCCPDTRGTDSLCNDLIKHGAKLVENVDDIYEEMNYKKDQPIF